MEKNEIAYKVVKLANEYNDSSICGYYNDEEEALMFVRSMLQSKEDREILVDNLISFRSDVTSGILYSTFAKNEINELIDEIEAIEDAG